MKKQAWIVLFAVLICNVQNQDIREIPPEVARQHVIKRFEPLYPEPAELARIQGVVELRVTINEKGNVTDLKPVMGHPLLLGSAFQAVKKWQFQPFIFHEQASPVRTIVQLIFALGPDAEREKDYLRKEVVCNISLQNNMADEAETVCHKALAIAKDLPNYFAPDKFSAYGNAGRAALDANRVEEAVDTIEQQLRFIKKISQPGNSQLVSVSSDLAHAYARAGHMPQADAQYTETEQAQIAAQKDLHSRKDKLDSGDYDAQSASYSHNLQVILKEHALLLRNMGKNSEADTLEQRANDTANIQAHP